VSNITVNGKNIIIVYINAKNREMSIVFYCISNSLIHTRSMETVSMFPFDLLQVNLNLSR